MKITVLIENHPGSCGLLCEHGLSLWIEYQAHKILLDAGASEAFAQNALLLDIDLSEATMSVLSHGHYDHSGGFGAFFEKNNDVNLLINEYAAGQYYIKRDNYEDIGIPQKVLEHKERLVLISGDQKIAEGIYLIPHHTEGLEKIGAAKKLYKKLNGQMMPDDFNHEQSLVIDTPDGLVIFNSCSHGGVETIINEVKAVLPTRPIYAYIGGMHMKGMTKDQETCTFTAEELDHLCEVICQEKINAIYTGHCTGDPGLEELKKRIPHIIHPLYTGQKIEL